MRIYELICPQERVEHIARQAVTPEEVEEVCFGKSWVRRAKSEGENPVYYVLGQTVAGRYLFCVVIAFPDGNGVQWIPGDRASDDRKRETSILKMEKPMKKSKLPKPESVPELAAFWDTHDLTDFEDELAEVPEPVFVPGRAIQGHLESDEVKAVQQKAFRHKS